MPEPIFACPRCGATTADVSFETVETAVVYYRIEPYLNEDGEVRYDYDSDCESEVAWDTAEIDPTKPYIRCPACLGTFYPHEFIVK